MMEDSKKPLFPPWLSERRKQSLEKNLVKAATNPPSPSEKWQDRVKCLKISSNNN